MQELDTIKQQEVNSLSAQAKGLIVSNTEEYSYAAEYLKTVKGALKRVNEKIIAPAEEVKRKAEVSRKNLVAIFRAPLLAAESILKSKMLTFDREAQAKADELQKKLQAEADAKAETERERLLNEASNLKTPELQEQRLAEAEEVEAPVITVQSEAPKVDGISTRKTWKARVVDTKGFILAATLDSNLQGFIMIDEKALNRVAQATKGQVSYPGIQFYQDESMAVSPFVKKWWYEKDEQKGATNASTKPATRKDPTQS